MSVEACEAEVCVTEYTDPGCPWAYSAEPNRWRLRWLYGDALGWRRRMVVLARDPQEYLDKGFTPAKQAAAFVRIARDHAMPIDPSERPRMAATLPACTAVVATRLHAPELEGALLRALRVMHFSGGLLDDARDIARAASEAGLDPAVLERWMEGDDVRAALEEDVAAARAPMPAARILDHKLANWSGGRRYTCPSYEIRRDAHPPVTIAVPGFQPLAAYDVVLANLRPDLERRESPSSVQEVLTWAGVPLATKEVAVVCDIPLDEARVELARCADADPLGTDVMWALPAQPSSASATRRSSSVSVRNCTTASARETSSIRIPRSAVI